MLAATIHGIDSPAVYMWKELLPLFWQHRYTDFKSTVLLGLNIFSKVEGVLYTTGVWS
jgi:hypothetical protein